MTNEWSRVGKLMNLPPELKHLVDPALFTSSCVWYNLRGTKDTVHLMCKFLSSVKISTRELESKTFEELDRLWFTVIVCRNELPFHPPNKTPSRLNKSKAKAMIHGVLKAFYNIDVSCNVETASAAEIELDVHPEEASEALLHEEQQPLPNSDSIESEDEDTTMEVATCNPSAPAVNRRELVAAPEEIVPPENFGELYVTRLRRYLRDSTQLSVGYFSDRDPVLSKIYGLSYPLKKHSPFYVFADFSFFPYCHLAVVISDKRRSDLPLRKDPYLFVQSPNTLDFTIGEDNLIRTCGLPVDEACQLLKSVIGLKGFVTVESLSLDRSV